MWHIWAVIMCCRQYTRVYHYVPIDGTSFCKVDKKWNDVVTANAGSHVQNDAMETVAINKKPARISLLVLNIMTLLVKKGSYIEKLADLLISGGEGVWMKRSEGYQNNTNNLGGSIY